MAQPGNDGAAGRPCHESGCAPELKGARCRLLIIDTAPVRSFEGPRGPIPMAHASLNVVFRHVRRSARTPVRHTIRGRPSSPSSFAPRVRSGLGKPAPQQVPEIDRHVTSPEGLVSMTFRPEIPISELDPHPAAVGLSGTPMPDVAIRKDTKVDAL